MNALSTSATLAVLMTLAGTLPHSSALPLSSVLTALENKGYSAITEIDFDHGQWEIEAQKADLPVELQVDPRTGEIVREQRDGRHAELPKDAKPLSDIIKQLEADGYLAIAEVDFSGTYWEIEATRSGSRFELKVDVHSGKVLSEEIDNQ